VVSWQDADSCKFRFQRIAMRRQVSLSLPTQPHHWSFVQKIPWLQRKVSGSHSSSSFTRSSVHTLTQPVFWLHSGRYLQTPPETPLGLDVPNLAQESTKDQR